MGWSCIVSPMSTNRIPMSHSEAVRVAARMVEFYRGDRDAAVYAANRSGMPEVAAAICGGEA